jgi:methionyl-tRNA formyltransferase
MLAKAETPIGEDETAGELFDRLMVLGAELLVDTIDKLDTHHPACRRTMRKQSTRR